MGNGFLGSAAAAGNTPANNMAPAASAPGLQGQTLSPNGLFLDPTTGMYTNGRQYFRKNPDGSFTQAHDLDMGSQVARDISAAGMYAGQAPQYAADYNQTFGKEMGLADMLQNTITNANAPSVAGTQEAQALQANEGTQLSQAAGASGANAAIARRNAGNNMAALGATDAQTGTLRRAQEVQGAQSNLGGLLQGAGAGAAGMYGQNTGLGLNYSQLGASSEGAGLANSTAQRGQNIGIAKDVVTGLGSAGAAAATGGGSTALSFAPPQGPDDIAHLQSDVRIKHDVAPESSQNEESFARALQPIAFKYNGQDQERHGVRAQDVENGGPIGKDLVSEDENGVKGLDVAQGLGAALSLLGYLHGKIQKLESKKGARRG